MIKPIKEGSEGIGGLSEIDIGCKSSPLLVLQTSKPKKKCTCKEILIVDDNHFNLSALSMHLEKSRFRIDTV